jgi:hypothetical protein
MERDHLGDLCIGTKIRLKCILKNQDVMMLSDTSG